MTKNLNFKNSKWRTPAILQIVKSLYLQKSSDFDEMWHTTAHLKLDDSHLTKCDFFFKFKMADVRYIENRLLAIFL